MFPQNPVRILSYTDDSGLCPRVIQGMGYMQALSWWVTWSWAWVRGSLHFRYSRKWISHEPEPKVLVRTLAPCKGWKFHPAPSLIREPGSCPFQV